MNSVWTTFAILGVAIPAFSQPPPEQYLGVRHDRLFASLQVNPDPKEMRWLSRSVTYTFRPETSNGLKFVIISVHPTEEDAHRGLFGSLVFSVGPRPAPQGEPVGDEFHWWHSSVESEWASATVLFRRRNVSVAFSRNGSADDALALARRVDCLIRDDRQIAPLGRFDPPPEIVSVGIPDTLPVGLRVPVGPSSFRDVPEESRYRFAPEFRGLGDPARLRVGIYELGRYYDTWNEVTPDGRSEPRIDVTVPTPFPPPLDFSVGSRERTPEEDGRFMLKLPLKPGPRRLVMVVVNDDNVVVTKEFQVTFTPR
jgi:hypothetical protein